MKVANDPASLRLCVYSVCVAALQLLQLKSRHEKRG